MAGSHTPRLVDIVGEAMALPQGEREAYVRGACPDEASRSEALSLLRALERAGGFMDRPTVAPSAAATGAATVREGPGVMVDRYRILEQIGEGGFGIVFLAEQREPVQRRVALKIIKPGMDTRSVVARFEQERQALAMMDHPNIAKVLDAGATQTGRPYFVMELVKGDPITDYCDQGTLPIDERIGLFTQVCAAVQHAHTKGIIHRDIKPSNVLVSVVDGRAAVKVIDFGIAKATARRLTDKTVYTEFRQLIGTPEYMSPEQAEGSLDIDTRTDVYSLGVMLYELLTGSPPFDSVRLRSAAYAEIQRIIREVDPPRPSTRLSQQAGTIAAVAARRRTEPGRLGTLVRGELDWIVMRALEKDRARRYDTAGGLAADLQRYLEGRPVEAAPPSSVYRARKFVARHRVPVAAGALVSLALVGGLAGTGVGMLKAWASEREAARQAVLARQSAEAASAQAARADREAEDARRSARAAESVNELMTGMIARADRGREDGRADITVREVLDAGSKELESRGNAYEPLVAMRLAKAIGETYRELALLEPAERMLRLNAEKQREVFGPGSAEYAGALNDVGGIVKARGDLDGAAALYASARAIAGPLGDAGAGTMALIANNAGALASARGDPAGAETEFRGAIAYYEGRGDTRRREYVQALNNLASVYFERGRLAEAEQYLARSTEIRRGLPGGNDPDGLLALHNLGSLRFAQHDVEGAERTVREEVDVARGLYGDSHLDVAHALDSLAIITGARGDPAGAAGAQRESVAIYRALLDPGHPSIGRSLKALGTFLRECGESREAEAVLTEACAILAVKPGIANPDSVYAHYELAGLMQKRGAHAEAERIARTTLDAAAASLVDGTPYEWWRHALSSLLGSIIADQAADPATPVAARDERFIEAERLIVSGAERLAGTRGRLGPRTRRGLVGAALDRGVRLYDAWNRIDPTSEHAAKLADWRARQAQLETDGGKGP